MNVCVFLKAIIEEKPIVKSNSQEKSTSGSVFWTEFGTGHCVSIKIETQTKELNQVTVVNNKKWFKGKTPMRKTDGTMSHTN